MVVANPYFVKPVGALFMPWGIAIQMAVRVEIWSLGNWPEGFAPFVGVIGVHGRINTVRVVRLTDRLASRWPQVQVVCRTNPFGAFWVSPVAFKPHCAISIFTLELFHISLRQLFRRCVTPEAIEASCKPTAVAFICVVRWEGWSRWSRWSR